MRPPRIPRDPARARWAAAWRECREWNALTGHEPLPDPMAEEQFGREFGYPRADHAGLIAFGAAAEVLSAPLAAAPLKRCVRDLLAEARRIRLSPEWIPLP